jgi:hypothetical protein
MTHEDFDGDAIEVWLSYDHHEPVLFSPENKPPEAIRGVWLNKLGDEGSIFITTDPAIVSEYLDD